MKDVRALASGSVIGAGFNPNDRHGWAVAVQYNAELMIRYTNLSSVSVKLGQIIDKGNVIGRSDDAKITLCTQDDRGGIKYLGKRFMSQKELSEADILDDSGLDNITVGSIYHRVNMSNYQTSEFLG